MPNAFAIPGGGIGLTTGLLEAMLTEEGMAFVLAHEWGIIQNAMFSKILAGYFVDRHFKFGDLTTVNLGCIEFLRKRIFTKQEKEADLFALNLAYSLYGDKEENFLEFFQKIKNDDLNTNGHWGALLSTHPN